MKNKLLKEDVKKMFNFLLKKKDVKKAEVLFPNDSELQNKIDDLHKQIKTVESMVDDYCEKYHGCDE